MAKTKLPPSSKTSKPEPPAEHSKRRDNLAKAFLNMEPQVHDLRRLASITYDHAANTFDVTKPGAPRAQSISIEEQDNILFLLERLVKASKELIEFYKDPAAAAEDDDD